MDSAGNVYITEGPNNGVLKLATGANTPVELPFIDVKMPTGVAVDTRGTSIWPK